MNIKPYDFLHEILLKTYMYSKGKKEDKRYLSLNALLLYVVYTVKSLSNNYFY